MARLQRTRSASWRRPCARSNQWRHSTLQCHTHARLCPHQLASKSVLRRAHILPEVATFLHSSLANSLLIIPCVGIPQTSQIISSIRWRPSVWLAPSQWRWALWAALFDTTRSEFATSFGSVITNYSGPTALSSDAGTAAKIYCSFARKGDAQQTDNDCNQVLNVCSTLPV